MNNTCKGAIAAGDQLTALAGAEILKAGGNAFDACIAATFMSFAASSSITSAGGGGFFLAYPAVGQPQLYDFFVQTPVHKRQENEIDFKSVEVNFGDKTQEFHMGMGSVATPGNIAGLFETHKNLGKLPMTEIMAPVLDFMKKGIKIHRQTKYQIDILTPILTLTENGRRIYLNENQPLQIGDSYYLSAMADTFEYLARYGPGEFYEGEIAKKVEELSLSGGGHLTRQDFRQYKVIRREPIGFSYRDHHVLTTPPPNAGGVLIAFLLSILESVKFKRDDFGKKRHLQALADAIRLTDQARLEKVELNIHQPDFIHDLFHPDFIASMRHTLLQSVHHSGNTTHVSAADNQGNIASCTTSVGEGCGYFIPGTDIMLNNMLGEEDLNKQGFHTWQPDRRMSSMMSPAVVIHPRGSLMGLGSGGSNRIRSALAQAIVNYVDFQLPHDDIVNLPRIHLEYNHLDVEPGFRQEELDRLVLPPSITQFQWNAQNMYFGGVHAVFRDARGNIDATGDRRRVGYAINVY